MMRDLDQGASLPDGRFDVCIAGGGVAGIVLARALVQKGRRVLLLEGGGLDFTAESQALYEGLDVGRAYYPLDTVRLRYLGGTSNHWTGWCRPIAAYDFEHYDYKPLSGWPIGRSDLDPFVSEAQQILEIGDFQPDAVLEGSASHLKELFFQQSPPVRFAEKYLDFLKQQADLTVLYNANLVDVRIDEGNGRVLEFVVRGQGEDAPQHRVEADSFVLALGGLENPRALLNANSQVTEGLGNGSGFVGRCFMEHPHNVLGYYVADPDASGFGRARRFIAPSEAFIRAQQIGNATLLVEPMPQAEESLVDASKRRMRQFICENDVILDLVRTVRQFGCPQATQADVLQDAPANAGILRVLAEQVPNPESRVKLADERDRFGLRRIALDWQLSDLDSKTMRTLGMEFGKFLAAQDFGRVKLAEWLLDDDPAVPGLDANEEVGAYHHMGTTRMAASPQDGVVDRNGRVFGSDNLFVAGSSVFSTAGNVNPTLTIVQLSLRLAEHLDGEAPS